MEDLTLEEFMKNPEKYREPEDDGKGPYTVHYENRHTGVKGIVSPGWFTRAFNDDRALGQPNEQKNADAAYEIMDALHSTTTWRKANLHNSHDLFLVDGNGVELYRITAEDYPPITEMTGDDLPF